MTFRHHDGSVDHSSGDRSGGDAVGSFAEAEAQDDPSGSGANFGADVGGPAGTMQSGVGSALTGDQPHEADDSQSRNPL
ncbi:MAG: hypothetical protein ABJA87_03460 [bacterium]